MPVQLIRSYTAPRRRDFACADYGDAAAAVTKLVEALGQPTRLRDVAVRPEHYDAIATGAMQNVFVCSNPRPITRPAQVREILDMAW